MFDLLGFWFNVSVIVGILLFPLLFIVPFIIGVFIQRVTRNGELALNISHKILKHDYYNDKFLIFNRYEINDFLFGLLITLTTAISSAFIVVVMYNSGNAVTSVAILSSKAAPYTGEVALLIVLYFGVEYLARKMWNVKTKVDSILEKGDE